MIAAKETRILAEEAIIIKNFVNCMAKTYREITQNWRVVQDILLNGTSKAAETSCIEKCRELNIDPYGYDFTRLNKQEDTINE